VKTSKSISLLRLPKGREPKRQKDEVAAEEPLEIRVQGHSLAVIMRTPGHDRELAAGFLLSEGVIRSAKDIGVITRCEDIQGGDEENVLNVLLAKGVAFDPDNFSRNFFVSSSCGLCGKASIEAVRARFKPLPSSPFKVSKNLLYQLPELLRRAQPTFEKTGGLHASALFDSKGRLAALREDVGRHNALDKLIGWGLFEGHLPFKRHLLILSGRVSFEMMQKALAAGIPVVAAIGAPSSLAVEFAKESGQTLAGFLREEKMNVYAASKRIV
jgi:FdhD protein